MLEASFRPGEASDEAAILALLARSLGTSRSARDQRWKHLDNPFGESYSRVAEVGGEVVAWRALLSWRWRAGDRFVAAVRAVDTVTDAAHRRRGLFSRLTRQLVEAARADGVGFVFNTPGPQSLPGYLKLGWRMVGRVPVLVRPLRPLRAGWRLLSGGGAPQGADVWPPDGFAPVRELLAADGLAELCAAFAAGDRRLSTPRTLDYLHWRYAAIPGFDYRALWILGDAAPAALIFHAAERRGLREIKVSEVLATTRPASRLAASQLLRRLGRSVKADYLVACAAPRSPERSALLRAAFLPTSRLGPRLTVLPLSENGRAVDPCTAASWRCSLGDFEIL